MTALDYDCGCVLSVDKTNIWLIKVCKTHGQKISFITHGDEGNIYYNTGKFIYEGFMFGAHSSTNSFNDATELIIQNEVWHFKPGEVVLDIGAAFGTYTLPALKQGALVLGFEPNEYLIGTLARNVEANDWTERCKLFQYGLSNIEGEVSYNATGTLAQIKEQSAEKIQVRRLDDVVKELGLKKIDMIKIDAEGAELDILLGGIHTILTFHPRIVIEVHSMPHINMYDALLHFFAKLIDKPNVRRGNTGRLFMYVQWPAPTPKTYLAPTPH